MLLYEKDLIQFLIDKNVVIRYRHNLRDFKLGIKRKGISLKTSRLLRNIKPDKYIQSFDWNRTKEGKLFWSDINSKWKKNLIALSELRETK